MKTINEKLKKLQQDIVGDKPITLMILGLGSVGTYLLDYLIHLANPKLKIVVVGRNIDKLQSDVNIIRTSATIRRQMASEIVIDANCDLNNVEQIAEVINKYNPHFIVNTSRFYSGLKYGSISWTNLRAYGIWTPLSISYARNIMMAYRMTQNDAITINTSYSDAVIPWLKSAGLDYFDFGSGNLNHLIPRLKFYIAKKFSISDFNKIDVTLAVSHFHDVVISKEGQTEGQKILLDVKYENKTLSFNQEEAAMACKIAMPTDQKRNMMNASSNFDIINSIIQAINTHTRKKIHTPGVNGEVGGYPYIFDGTQETVHSSIDTSVFSLESMRKANAASIYLDGIKKIENGKLYYTTELQEKVKNVFQVELPPSVGWEEIPEVTDFLIENIIKSKVLSK